MEMIKHDRIIGTHPDYEVPVVKESGVSNDSILKFTRMGGWVRVGKERRDVLTAALYGWASQKN